VNVVSWNVNSLNVRLPQVLDFLAEARPDVMALQETKLPDERFPRTALRALGYEACFIGQKTYNGVALISRSPASDVVRELPGMNDGQRRLIAATIDGVRIVNVYVPNGQAVGSEKYAYKRRWLLALRAFLADELAAHPRLVVLGDFNIAPSDLDVHDPERWRGRIMCSEEERRAFASLLALGLDDVLRRLHPHQPLYTWWDYRLAAYRRGWGLRIDHLLVSRAIRALRGGVREDMRAAERPSDHAPVWAELAG